MCTRTERHNCTQNITKLSLQIVWQFADDAQSNVKIQLLSSSCSVLVLQCCTKKKKRGFGLNGDEFGDTTKYGFSGAQKCGEQITHVTW